MYKFEASLANESLLVVLIIDVGKPRAVRMGGDMFGSLFYSLPVRLTIFNYIL